MAADRAERARVAEAVRQAAAVYFRKDKIHRNRHSCTLIFEKLRKIGIHTSAYTTAYTYFFRPRSRSRYYAGNRTSLERLFWMMRFQMFHSDEEVREQRVMMLLFFAAILENP